MDTTILAALIGAAAVILAALIPFLIIRIKDRGKKSEQRDKLEVVLFVVLGDGYLEPIKLSLYKQQTPETIVSKRMDDPLALPASMRTTMPRRLYWKEGNRFLENKKSYGRQGVSSGHTLLLIDQSNATYALGLLEVMSMKDGDGT